MQCRLGNLESPVENQTFCWSERESSQNYNDLFLCGNVFWMIRTWYTWSKNTTKSTNEITSPRSHQGECNIGLFNAEILHRFFKQRASPCMNTMIRMQGAGHTARLPEGERKTRYADLFSTTSYVAYPDFLFPAFSFTPLSDFEEKHLSLCS